MALKTDYKDDIIDSSVNVNRTFSIIDNTTGQIIYPNVSLEETTVFSQEGDSHTAQITNEQNTEINQLNSDLFDNMTRLSTDTLSSSNVSMSYPSNTKIISITGGINGKYYGLPYYISKAKLGEFIGSKILVCGRNEGTIIFNMTTTGITNVTASNDNVRLVVKCFG